MHPEAKAEKDFRRFGILAMILVLASFLFLGWLEQIAEIVFGFGFLAFCISGYNAITLLVRIAE